jgi:hypothetical protein
MKNPFVKLKKLTEKTDKKSKNNFKIENEKYKYVSTLRRLSFFVIAILLAIFISIAIFVYQTIINAIEQAQSISLYQSELRVILIDFNGLDKIEAGWAKKHKVELIEIEKNPFIPLIKIIETEIVEEEIE